jgi:hypothetical protein
MMAKQSKFMAALPLIVVTLMFFAVLIQFAT